MKSVVEEGLFGGHKPITRITALKKEVADILKSIEAQTDIDPIYRRGLLTIQQEIDDLIKMASAPSTPAPPVPIGAKRRGSYGEPLAEMLFRNNH